MALERLLHAAHFGRKSPLRTHRTSSAAPLRCSFFIPNCTHIQKPQLWQGVEV
jgi:hypothetical protein